MCGKDIFRKKLDFNHNTIYIDPVTCFKKIKEGTINRKSAVIVKLGENC